MSDILDGLVQNHLEEAVTAALKEARDSWRDDTIDGTGEGLFVASMKLRAALSGLSTGLQRWTVALQLDSARHEAVLKALVARELRMSALEGREAAASQLQASLSIQETDLAQLQVSPVQSFCFK